MKNKNKLFLSSFALSAMALVLLTGCNKTVVTSTPKDEETVNTEENVPSSDNNEETEQEKRNRDIRERYGMRMLSSASQTTGVTLKDVNLHCPTFSPLPTDGSHLFGTYDYVANNGIDFIFDFSYTPSGRDTWFYYYLFNGKNEDGVVIRLNTNRSGDQKGYIYSQSVQYEGNLPRGAGSPGTCFTCSVPGFDCTNGYIRVRANLIDATNNTFNVKVYLGVNGDETDYPAIMADGERAGQEMDITVTLGAGYFDAGTHQTVRISNQGSDNAMIRNHVVSDNMVTYLDEYGEVIGTLCYEDGFVLPQLEKEGAEFLGWYDENGHLVSQGYEAEGPINIQAKFVDYVSITKGQTINIAPNASQTLTLNASLGEDNYLAFDYTSNEQIKGILNLSTSSGTRQEEFFLDNADTTFNTFLDVFRNSGSKKATTTLKSIEFKNVGATTATLAINEIKHAPRNLVSDETYYIRDNIIKAGVSLRLGGALSSLQNLNQDTVEYINNNNEVKIRSRSLINDGIKKEIKSNPNLINIYDLGRELQQSYYFNVDSNNGYTRAKYLGNYCEYNPVQSGDQNLNQSKIIDFRVADDSIWIKVQAADWAQNNSLTKSYMTNTYKVKNGLVYVDNSFINWYGFTNYNVQESGYVAPSSSVPYATQELPALYTVHPLDYFSSSFDGHEIYDNKLGWNVGTTAIERTTKLKLNSDGVTYRGDYDDGSYHYEFRQHYENWCGYLNEDKFGVALYMNAGNYYHDDVMRHVYVAGNFRQSHNLSYETNRMYYDANYTRHTPSMSDFIKNPVESAIIDNTNYICTVLGFLPREYVKLNWSYALGADNISTLKNKFAIMRGQQELVNDFTAWAGVLI
ncbi:MAG: hypothetical protein MJ213_05475 [Bacilli bacterium]|nr:hypothetical protein [Bacilli bacterium]